VAKVVIERRLEVESRELEVARTPGDDQNTHPLEGAVV